MATGARAAIGTDTSRCRARQSKTEMLQLKLAEKRGELVRQSDVDALIDELVGVTLTAMSSMPARCAPRGDLATRPVNSSSLKSGRRWGQSILSSASLSVRSRAWMPFAGFMVPITGLTSQRPAPIAQM